ncbi:hypothetical protein [Exiguobacterium sp. s161]|uniref:hypothetical protein n=1 Tax=Exiguobacterium sp. s161 TaxID=2751191 RepID=UPI001BEB408B|nr:hypothetical protein [Exiguobacterium sp. s161]
MNCCVCNTKLEYYLIDAEENVYCSEKCFATTLPTCTVCHESMENWITSDGANYCSESCIEASLDSCEICAMKLREWIEVKGKKYCSESCLEKTLDCCNVCNNPLHEWIESEGDKYCSESCFKSTWPDCAICGCKMDKWTESEGDKYCSESCFTMSLPSCIECGTRKQEWLRTDDDRIYCGETCYMESLPSCVECGNHSMKWIVADDQVYCSNDCLTESAPSCVICGTKSLHWIEADDATYCNTTCYQSDLPKCKVCGESMEQWYVSDEEKYCSVACHNQTLDPCMNCGKPLHEWIVTNDGRKYCDETCFEESTSKVNGLLLLSEVTGLFPDEILAINMKEGWTTEEFATTVDAFLEVLETGTSLAPSTALAFKNAGVFDRLYTNLSSYNTMRGGTSGFKGFVFEELHAAHASVNGVPTTVLSNNGAADFMIVNLDGTRTLGQAKLGYNTSVVDWSKYKGQTIVIDKGNQKLLESARAAGMDVIESNISNKQATSIAKMLQAESHLRVIRNAPITARVISMHQSGVVTAKKGGLFGAGFSLGGNMVDLISGEKDLKEAGMSVSKDVALATATSYATGMLAATPLGVGISTAATGAGTYLAGTMIGAAVVGGASAVTGSLAASSVGTIVATGTATLATTAIGTAVASSVLGGAVIAAAPVVAAGVVFGGLVKFGKKLLGR